MERTHCYRHWSRHLGFTGAGWLKTSGMAIICNFCGHNFRSDPAAAAHGCHLFCVHYVHGSCGHLDTGAGIVRVWQFNNMAHCFGVFYFRVALSRQDWDVESPS